MHGILRLIHLRAMIIQLLTVTTESLESRISKKNAWRCVVFILVSFDFWYLFLVFRMSINREMRMPETGGRGGETDYICCYTALYCGYKHFFCVCIHMNIYCNEKCWSMSRNAKLLVTCYFAYNICLIECINMLLYDIYVYI